MKLIAAVIILFAGILFALNKGALFGHNNSDIVEITNIDNAGQSAEVPMELVAHEAARLAEQMNEIAIHLRVDRQLYLSKIIRATEACMPVNTKISVIAALSKYVVILSETTDLPVDERQAIFAQGMIKLGTLFNTSISNLSVQEQETAYEQLTELLAIPTVLFECQETWVNRQN